MMRDKKIRFFQIPLPRSNTLSSSDNVERHRSIGRGGAYRRRLPYETITRLIQPSSQADEEAPSLSAAAASVSSITILLLLFQNSCHLR